LLEQGLNPRSVWEGEDRAARHQLYPRQGQIRSPLWQYRPSGGQGRILRCFPTTHIIRYTPSLPLQLGSRQNRAVKRELRKGRNLPSLQWAFSPSISIL